MCLLHNSNIVVDNRRQMPQWEIQEVRSYCMQGKKVYAERLFTSFQLSDHVPEENFYRRLKGAVDFGFIQHLTRAYYGKCGQKSIDPEVFIKLGQFI